MGVELPLALIAVALIPLAVHAARKDDPDREDLMAFRDRIVTTTDRDDEPLADWPTWAVRTRPFDWKIDDT